MCKRGKKGLKVKVGRFKVHHREAKKMLMEFIIV